MRKVTVLVFALMFAGAAGCSQDLAQSPVAPATPASASGLHARPQPDLPVTTVIGDVDGTGAAADISSDGLGTYAHGVNAVKSILAENGYNGIKHGDWQFSTTTSARGVGHTFDTEDALQPGDPNFIVAANPPFWGTQVLSQKNLAVACTFLNRSMLTMTAGSSMTCPMHNTFVTAGGVEYGNGPAYSFTGHPETTDVQVVCNSANAGGCSDWFIEPINLGEAIARLGRKLKFPKPGVNEGAFRLRFRIHVTRP